MIGEVSELRQKQAAVEAELAEKQGELEAATAALKKEKEHLEEVRAQLGRALGVLRERLVAIYEAGSPSVVNAILESDNWSDMAAQTEYLNRIQSYDDSVVDRVKTLRDEVTGRGREAGRQPRQGQAGARLDRRDRARSRRRHGRGRGPLRRTEVGPGRAPRSDGRPGKRRKKR